MGNLISILGLLVGLLGGGGVFITWMLYRKQTKRFKEAEAFEKDAQAWKTALESLQNQVNWQEERLSILQKTLLEKESYVLVISKEKDILEVKHAKNKSAINKAHGCELSSSCPVLKQQAKNDDEYIHSIEKVK